MENAKYHNCALIAVPMLLFSYLIICAPSFDLLPWVNQRYDDKRIVEVAIIILGLITAFFLPLHAGTDQKDGTGNTVTIALCLLASLGIASSLLGANPRYGLLELSLFAGLFCFSLLIAHTWLMFGYRMVLGISTLLLLSATIYTTGFFAGYSASFLTNTPLRAPEPFYGFSSIRFFNQYQIWTFSLLSLPILLTRRLRPAIRNALLLLLSAWWLIFFASNSRGVIIAMAVAFIATGLLYRRTSLPLLKIQTTTMLSGLTGYIILFQIIPKIVFPDIATGTPLRSSTSDRTDLWLHAIEMVTAHPWLGVGPMHFASIPSPGGFSHPHNSLLQWAAEWGIPSLLIVITLFIFAFHHWYQQFNARTLQNHSHRDRQLPIALLFSSTAGFSYSLVSGVIVMPMSQIMMATVVGLMIGVHRQYATNNRCASKYKEGVCPQIRGRKISQMILSGALLLTFLWAVLPDLLPRVMGQEEFLMHSYTTFGPRFWQQGGDFSITRPLIR